MFNDIVLCLKEQQEPNWTPFGISKLAEWLFLGGEDDVDQIINDVDIWIDLRHINRWNRQIYLPDHVSYVRMPFMDGDLIKAEETLPMAKVLVLQAKQEGKRCLISCNAGVSRSALLAFIVLSDISGNPKEALSHIKSIRPIVEFHDNFQPIVSKIIR